MYPLNDDYPLQKQTSYLRTSNLYRDKIHLSERFPGDRKIDCVQEKMRYWYETAVHIAFFLLPYYRLTHEYHQRRSQEL